VSRVIYFKFWSSSHICGIGEAKHFKFRALTDTEEYYCMHDRSPRKWMCSDFGVMQYIEILGN